MRSFTKQLTLLIVSIAALWATNSSFAQSPKLEGVNIVFEWIDFHMDESVAITVDTFGYKIVLANVDLWRNSPNAWRHFQNMIKLGKIYVCTRDEGNTRGLNSGNVNNFTLYGFNYSDLRRPNGDSLDFEQPWILFINPTNINPSWLPDSLWWNQAHGRRMRLVLSNGPVDGAFLDNTFGRLFVPPPFDLDRNKLEDIVGQLWSDGVKLTLANDRREIGHKPLLILNGRDIPVEFVPDTTANGRHIERVPDNFGEFPTPFHMMAHLRDWLEKGRAPQLVILQPRSFTNEQDVLFATSCALILGRQAFLMYPKLNWSTNIRNILKAQLGDEIVKGARWDTLAQGDVFGRDYRGGKVLVNMSSRVHAIRFVQKYFTLDSVLTDSISLAPQSGAILLNAEPTAIDEPNSNGPNEFDLAQNYPNPFNPETTIRYTLPKADQVRLIVYDLLGQEVRTLVAGTQQAGHYTVTWNGKDVRGDALPTGVYFYELKTTDGAMRKRMTLLR